jgi:hypothetical protein
MILEIANKVACGAYGHIFQSPSKLLAYKLFLSGHHPASVSQSLTSPEHETRRRNIFLSECDAYKRAAKHPLLCTHIPKNFQIYVIEDVIDLDRSVADLYKLDCCYAMEFIEGTFTKLRPHAIVDQPDHIKNVLKAFTEAGIFYLEDASIFCRDDPENFRIIDFATRDFQSVL